MMENNFDRKIDEMQDHITLALTRIIDSFIQKYPTQFKQQIIYQLGLEQNGIVPRNSGKRLRPLFVLLSCELFGCDWKKGLPGAAAVELLHNFSLIHDDIQDGSETRRGQASVWKVWGVPQAINAGDALLNLAYLAVYELNHKIPDHNLNSILFILQKTCLELTNGQYMDMAFESEKSISLDQYWQMIEGKTASLLSACFRLGAVIAEAKKEDEDKFAEAGKSLGLAFQIQDDYLGIWGNEKLIGKSVSSDLIARKKTYPVLMGLDQNMEFADYWNKVKNPTVNDAQKFADLLDQEQIRDQVMSKYKELYKETLQKINELSSNHRKLDTLKAIIISLETRDR